MADIYTPEWFDSVRDAINAKVVTLRDVPAGSWLVAVDIAGDGVSPYVEAGAERHFLIRVEDGCCAWYREGEAGPDDELSYRFRGPAAAFDEVAAGVLDPIDAALRGAIQADHVKALLEAYATVDTAWPHGAPPYSLSRETVDA
jgi:hypothetical protein